MHISLLGIGLTAPAIAALQYAAVVLEHRGWWFDDSDLFDFIQRSGILKEVGLEANESM